MVSCILSVYLQSFLDIHCWDSFTNSHWACSQNWKIMFEGKFLFNTPWFFFFILDIFISYNNVFLTKVIGVIGKCGNIASMRSKGKRNKWFWTWFKQTKSAARLSELLLTRSLNFFEEKHIISSRVFFVSEKKYLEASMASALLLM